MLGQIEFAHWQCLAELIDNSIDALRNAEASDDYELSKDDYCIEVYLPDTQNDPNASVEIRDHAPGMDVSKLQQAVRAGWSGNGQFDQLGLFGMGFNVATARLGSVTRVTSTQKSDQKTIGVEIDLNNIGEDFEAEDLELDKEDPNEHGTSVLVTELDRDRANWLATHHLAIRKKLGHIYSWILSNTEIKLRVNGRVVEPKRLCAWGENRSVTRGSGRNAEVIPAIIPIDERLGDADACSDCGNWQNRGHEYCESCGSANISPRERRIHGWVGIQRYLDQNSFGIDFIRNGRKIVTYDKDVFSWLDPNNPSAVPELEYPVEVPADQGRIIGEIHIDHVPVHYMKDRFDTDDRSWKSAMEFLRGPGPLKPQRARQLNYPENNSPIGRLFKGYRRNDPGSSYLVPGDGARAVHQQASEWGLRFDRGDGEYQDDSKWWEAVKFHDEQQEIRNRPNPPENENADVDAVLRALQGAQPTPDSDTNEEQSDDNQGNPTPPTIQERVQSLLDAARPFPTLTREIYSRTLRESLNVRAHEVGDSPLIDANNDAHTPVWLFPAEGGSADVFIDVNHEMFTEHGAEVLDLALSQIAHFMLTRSNISTHSISQIAYELRRENFADEKADFVTIQTNARDLLNHVRSRLIELITDHSHQVWGLLSTEEIGQMESSILSSGTGQSLDSSDSSFLQMVPAKFLLKLFNNQPEIFLDGNVFQSPYNSLQDEVSKEICASRISSLLIDVVSVASEERTPASQNHLKRCRLAVEILQSELTA